MSEQAPTPPRPDSRPPTTRAAVALAGVPPRASGRALDRVDRPRLVVVLLALAATALVVVRRPLPQTTGEVEVPGLGADVEVLRDAHGIPQLYADTDADLMRAQGYVHAQERFFEMDFRRHVTAARLSELFGEDTLETDRFIRTMGWRRVAEREWALLAPRDARRAHGLRRGRQRLPRRAQPVRAVGRVRRARLSGLDYTPRSGSRSTRWAGSRRWRGTCAATWTPRSTGCCSPRPHPGRDRLALAGLPLRRAPADRVRRRRRRDGVFEQNASGNATRNPRRPAYPPRVVEALERVQQRVDAMPRCSAPAARRQQLVGRRRRPQRHRHAAARQRPPTSAPASPASGCRWACTAARPARTAPSTPAGFTFSGVPGVIIGHNADIAWGFTNLGPT